MSPSTTELPSRPKSLVYVKRWLWLIDWYKLVTRLAFPQRDFFFSTGVASKQFHPGIFYDRLSFVLPGMILLFGLAIQLIRVFFVPNKPEICGLLWTDTRSCGPNNDDLFLLIFKRPYCLLSFLSERTSIRAGEETKFVQHIYAMDDVTRKYTM